MDDNKKQIYSKWRKDQYTNKTGFFPIFNSFEEKMKELSPGATYLFIYLGMHSNYEQGTSFYSIATLAIKLNKSPRTISNWIKELENEQLIYRKQHKVNQVSTTYLLPY